MKKGVRTAVIIILGLIFVVSAVVLITALPMLAMKPLETGAILDTDIYAVRSRQNNVFAFQTGNGYALIDAGSDAAEVKKALDQLQIDATSVRHVLLTHTDSDHVASLGLFPDAEIYICEDEKQMIDGTTRRNLIGSNALPAGIDIGSLIPLVDDQDLRLGERTIRCIKTPGHTPGSMSFALDGKYLFTGDAARIGDEKLSVHPFTMDESSAKASIARIEGLRGDYPLSLSAHYGYIENDEAGSR